MAEPLRASLLLALLARGCIADLVPLYGHDAGAGGSDLSGDLTQGPAVFADIQSDMMRLGCSACHNGTFPNATMMYNSYADVSGQAMMGDQSPLLLYPLATSSQTHTGGKSFKDTTDATYQRWLAWITAGNPQ